jgi:hypothetical protein
MGLKLSYLINNVRYHVHEVREACGLRDIQEIIRLLWNRKVQYPIHKTVPFLVYIN